MCDGHTHLKISLVNFQPFHTEMDFYPNLDMFEWLSDKNCINIYFHCRFSLRFRSTVSEPIFFFFLTVCRIFFNVGFENEGLSSDLWGVLDL